MKPAATTNLVIFLLLTVVVTASALGINEAVMDAKGRPVKPNKPYFIHPAGQPEVWISRHQRFLDIQCPQVAVLSDRHRPLSVVFLLQSGADYVPLSTNLSIRYDAYDHCPESGIWRVDKSSPFPTPDITAAGSVFAPDSTFTIQKDNDVYKFVYESSSVGVFTEPTSLIEHLVLNPNSLDVIFVPKGDEPGYKEASSYLKTTVPFIY
ncbi:hypothetical protein EUTSA_v10010972mg [Eutrema salsugineum]|uniref:Uncharacterized protein n=1 Tax=Eutrema salsugineum TaxID=72664 RepID=V4LM96_EUTSA|nr:uncharacterized protein LOC18021583 [Eutrema salsugineum]ESQ44884.1 hypothetical protein EUTSA_v10010972mg [Eutrema salsugineum]